MHTDEELAKLSQENDRESFAELVKRYLKPVYNFIRRYIGNREDAEDITQEAFLKAFKNIKKFNPDKNFKVWLFVIAKNTAFDRLKKKKPLVFSQLQNEDGESIIEEIADAAPLPDEIFARKELTKELESILDILPPSDRAILTLHYSDGLTFEEIAEILGKPMNTVKSRHRRALLRLRDFLTHQK